MTDNLRRAVVSRVSVALAVLALVTAGLLLVGPSAGTAHAAGGTVKCKLKGKKSVVCPSAQLRGPAGPSGPSGPAGGSGGSGGVYVYPFKFLAGANQSQTDFVSLAGGKIQASCVGSTIQQARFQSNTSATQAALAVNINAGTSAGGPTVIAGGNVSIIPGLATTGSAQAAFTFSYLAPNGSQVAAAQYAAFQSGGTTAVAGAYDCAIFGTIQVV